MTGERNRKAVGSRVMGGYRGPEEKRDYLNNLEDKSLHCDRGLLEFFPLNLNPYSSAIWILFAVLLVMLSSSPVILTSIQTWETHSWFQWEHCGAPLLGQTLSCPLLFELPALKIHQLWYSEKKQSRDRSCCFTYELSAEPRLSITMSFYCSGFFIMWNVDHNHIWNVKFSL